MGGELVSFALRPSVGRQGKTVQLAQGGQVP
jgi:hypothetical protein